MNEIDGPHRWAWHTAATISRSVRTRAAGRIRARCVFLAIVVVLLGTSGCAPYNPPFQGDLTAQRYQSDLASCRTSSREAVRLKNAATPSSWIISPITGPPKVRAAIRKCMENKGYVLEKTAGLAARDCGNATGDRACTIPVTRRDNA